MTIVISACQSDTLAPDNVCPLPERVTRGAVLMPSRWENGVRGYGSREGEEALAYLYRIGVQEVTLSPYIWMDDLDETSIHGEHVGKVRPGDPRLSDLEASVHHAKSLGLEVMLKPYLWVEGGKWRGNIEPRHDDGSLAWDAWWREYKAAILFHARFAERVDADGFTIGSELVTTLEHDPRRLVELVHDVREVYSGKLTYGANWSETIDPSIWRSLDTVSVHFYPPLSPEPEPPVEDVRRSIRTNLTAWSAVAASVDRPLVIAEVGYKSAPRALQKPYLWPSELPPQERVEHEYLQRLGHHAFFLEARRIERLEGIAIWVVYTDLKVREEGVGGFAFHGKEAEGTIRNAFASTTTPEGEQWVNAMTILAPALDCEMSAVAVAGQIVHKGYALTHWIVTALSVFFVLVLGLRLLWVRRLPTPDPYDLELAREHLPRVTIQIPTFNDVVALRCLECCLALDYPIDRLQIMIVDDSSDPEVADALERACQQAPARVLYRHRDHRRGFKPGALQDALGDCDGEFIALFDADWMPREDFLLRALPSFEDPNVAVVQMRQGHYNQRTNLVTRFASYLLIIYHHIFLPIQNRINAVFFCGTAGVIRRSALERVGGWNEHSITEDAELTIRLLLEGYRNVYLPSETPGEVPVTLKQFLRQQQRWCGGNVRIFKHQWRLILLPSALSIPQRCMILFVTMSHIFAPAVLLMVITGVLGWGLPHGEGSAQVFIERIIYTGGFSVLGAGALTLAGCGREIGWFLISSLLIGPLLACVNSYTMIVALVQRRSLGWVCTPKRANALYAKELAVVHEEES